MARLRSFIFSFGVPTGENTEDLAGFRIFVVKDGQEPNLDEPTADLLVSEAVDGELTFDLKNAVTESGKYDVYVLSYDEAGNESDLAVLEDAAIDFTAPAKPVNLRLR